MHACLYINIICTCIFTYFYMCLSITIEIWNQKALMISLANTHIHFNIALKCWNMYACTYVCIYCNMYIYWHWLGLAELLLKNANKRLYNQISSTSVDVGTRSRQDVQNSRNCHSILKNKVIVLYCCIYCCCWCKLNKHVAGVQCLWGGTKQRSRWQACMDYYQRKRLWYDGVHKGSMQIKQVEKLIKSVIIKNTVSIWNQSWT